MPENISACYGTFIPGRDRYGMVGEESGLEEGKGSNLPQTDLS